MFNKVKKDQTIDEKTIEIKRVSKKVKGGNNISFTALVGVGNGKGSVGIGLGRSAGVPEAIKKAVRKAKANMITFPLNGTTVPCDIEFSLGAARLKIKPAPRGSGIMAGGPLRALFDLAGVKDVSAKILGTNNGNRNCHILIKALEYMSDHRVPGKERVADDEKV